MDKSKKIKIFIGSIYLLILSTFLYFLFSNFNFEEINSFKLIQTNIDALNVLKDTNLFFLLLVFFIFTVLWVSMLGFGTPIALIGGFIFGKWIGTILVTLSLTTGALNLYLIGKYFFYDFLKIKLFKKFKYLESMFHKNQIVVMIIFRFVGFVPFFIANLLPVIFNIKPKNYYIGTFIGILPSIFIMTSLGSGFSKAIYSFDSMPSFFSIISLPEIYYPLIGFLCIIIITIFLKKRLNEK
tara:strand:+ start:2445 stop:3164 length:720 start_codon:yes stop_codon:yes gene_type:complete